MTAPTIDKTVPSPQMRVLSLEGTGYNKDCRGDLCQVSQRGPGTQVAELLWTGTLPDQGDLTCSQLPEEVVEVLRLLPASTTPMDCASHRGLGLGLSCRHSMATDRGPSPGADVLGTLGSGRVASAVAGAIGALKGPWHGGAPSEVVDQLHQIESIDQAEAWVRGILERGERLMGFGHRGYRAYDPRAAALRQVAEGLSAVADWLEKRPAVT